MNWFKNSLHLLCLLLILSFNATAKDKISLSETETAYLKTQKRFTLCADPNWAPFEKIENGKYRGISADYFELFGEELGVEFEIQTTKTWQETLQKIKNDECDVVSLYLADTNDLQNVKLTQQLIKVPLVLATKKDQRFIANFADLKNKKIAIVQGYSYKHIISNEISNLIFVDVKTPEEGLRLVIKGEVVGYLDAFPVIAYLIQTQFFNEIALSAKLDQPLKFSSAVSTKHPLLLSALNKTINSLSASDKFNIYSNHFKINYQNQNVFNTKEFFVILFIALFFSLFVAYRYKTIKMHNYAMQAKIDIIDSNVLLIITKPTGEIKYASSAFVKLSGYSKTDLKGILVKRLKFNYEKDRETDIKSSILSHGFWRGEIQIRKSGGSYFWAEITMVNSNTIQKNYSGYHVIFNDITHKKRLEELSQTDTLTKLNSRLFLDEKFEDEFLRVSRYQTQLSILIVDIDFFKLVNDDYGHHIGDQVLVTFSNILKTTARNTDIVGRWGGEEFLIICPETSLQGSFTLAEKIRKQVERQDFETVGKITCSIGVTQHKQQDSPNDMFIRADNALYQAKKEGRNKIVFHD